MNNSICSTLIDIRKLYHCTWVKQTIKKKVVTYLGKKKKTWTIPFTEQLSFMKLEKKNTMLGLPWWPSG